MVFIFHNIVFPYVSINILFTPYLPGNIFIQFWPDFSGHHGRFQTETFPFIQVTCKFVVDPVQHGQEQVDIEKQAKLGLGSLYWGLFYFVAPWRRRVRIISPCRHARDEKIYSKKVAFKGKNRPNF
jgi:hypothetical protein